MQMTATNARAPIRATRPSFISVPLLPVPTRGERSLAREWRLPPVNFFPLLRGHARYQPWRPEFGFALCCAPRSQRWSEPARQLDALLPEHEIPQRAPRAVSARTQPYAHRQRRYLPSTSRPRPPSCFYVRRARVQEACARSPYTARTATPA